jgi:putative ATPase
VQRYTQRFYRLLEPNWLDAQLYQKLILAEEAIYADRIDPMFN